MYLDTAILILKSISKILSRYTGAGLYRDTAQPWLIDRVSSSVAAVILSSVYPSRLSRPASWGAGVSAMQQWSVAMARRRALFHKFSQAASILRISFGSRWENGSRSSGCRRCSDAFAMGAAHRSLCATGVLAALSALTLKVA